MDYIKKQVQTNGQKQIQIIDLEKNSEVQIHLGDGVFPKGNVRLSHWNINGLRAILKKGKLQEWLTLNKYKYDIICFNEIRTDEQTYLQEKLSQQLPKEYKRYFNFSKQKAGYSGVGIISTVKPISVTPDIGIMKHDLDGRVLTAEFEKFTLISVYVPTAGHKLTRLEYRQEWDRDFKDFLKNQINKNKPLIVAGDFNVSHRELDVYNPQGKEQVLGYTFEERFGFNDILNEGLVDTFRYLHPLEQKFTYYNLKINAKKFNNGWRLDYFLITQNHLAAVTRSDVDPNADGSDHLPIELQIDLNML